MDMNLYFTEWLVRERLADARAASARDALAQAVRPQRRPVRARLGAALVSLGRRLEGRRPRRADALATEPPFSAG
jgi:hypothetical protein